MALLGGRARAQEPDYAAARQHYKDAMTALDKGEYAIAAREFGVAYEITRDPILFYKIAFAYEKAGDCEAALIYYRRYLKEAKPSEKEKADAEAHVVTCEGKGGGAPPPPPPDTGEGSKPPPPDTGAGTMAPDFGEGSEEPPPPPGPGEGPPSFADEGGTWKRTGAWILVGVAVAGGTTAAVLGLSASSREEDIDNLIRFRDASGRPAEFEGQTARRYQELVDEGDRYDRYSKIAMIATGAAAAGAVLLFVLEAREPEPEAAHASGRGTLSPVVGADGFGLAAGWEF